MGREHLVASEYVVKEENDVQVADPVMEEMKDRAPVPEPGREDEILIVEDHAELRSYIGENLSDRYRIIEAGDGKEGLEKALAHVPDLVVTDVMMPGMNGVELCSRLKTYEGTSHIPVIMLTAKSTPADKIEGLEQGADDYISKPFDIKELKVRIRNLLDLREKLRQKYSGMVGLDWSEISVTTLDEQFLKKVTGVICTRLQDEHFNVGALQKEMAMSRVNLFRKLKALTGETPSSLIRSLRLKTAEIMLVNGSDSITTIALDSGFSNSSVFAHLFKKEYGITPREYRKRGKTGDLPNQGNYRV